MQPWPKVQLQESAKRTARNGAQPLRAFCYAGEMTGSLDQFVLIKASKSLGGVWSDDDYLVRDRARSVVVGRIFTRKHQKTSRGSGR